VNSLLGDHGRDSSLNLALRGARAELRGQECSTTFGFIGQKPAPLAMGKERWRLRGRPGPGVTIFFFYVSAWQGFPAARRRGRAAAAPPFEARNGGGEFLGETAGADLPSRAHHVQRAPCRSVAMNDCMVLYV